MVLYKVTLKIVKNDEKFKLDMNWYFWPGGNHPVHSFNLAMSEFVLMPEITIL